MKRHLLLLLASMLIAGTELSSAQQATLQGTVLDSQSGEELIGAHVLLIGTAIGGITDTDGGFVVRGIPPGSYDVRVSYVGYTPTTIAGVVLRSDESLKLEVTLTVETLNQEEVVITGERVLATEAALLADRRLSATIGDGFSAEQIRQTPDATSSDALRRVTGLTIVDNKFVYVRGVTDRYNSTSLNGVTVTSTDTDTDRKSFAFDMVPSNLLENTVVVKTATPDMPGDFSGGFVKVNTMSFPANRVVRLGVSSSYNSISSTRGFMTSQGGNRDWLGFDDGTRALSAGSGNTQQIAQSLPNTWGARNTRAPINGSFNLALGDRLPIDQSELGVVGALSYANTFTTTGFTEAPSYVYGGTPVFRFNGTRYGYGVLWAGLLDLNLKLSNAHTISFRNSYNQSAEDRVSVARGVNIAGSDSRRQTTEWNERSLYIGQIGGTHMLSELNGLEAQWKLFASSSRAQEPDRKQVEYTLGSMDDASLGENYRTWSALNEKSRGASLDLTYPLGPASLKTGASVEMKDRGFGIQAFSTIPGRDTRYYSLLLLPLDQIFASQNYEAGKLSFISATAFTGAYTGSQRLNAYYAMVDVPFTVLEQQFRVTGGARLENADINVLSPKAIDDPTLSTAHLQHADILPSLNLTYAVSGNMNLRLAHYQSVNRPEFRELANVLYLDFEQDQNVIGNPALTRAYVHNYDVRFEVFPEPGEVLAVSYFTKYLRNAIEERLIAAPDRYVKTWFNSPQATNRGWEFEVRKSLAFLGGPFANLSVSGNYTIIRSDVEYTETRTDQDGRPVVSQTSRPMQGQSPWTWNISAQYAITEWKTVLSILYNKFGRRLNAVGDVREQDVYEEPRDIVDLAITQELFAGFEAKASIRNLSGKSRVLTSGEQQVPYASWTQGTTYALSLSLSL